DQQGAHVAHLTIIDHRERGLHAVEKLDHRHQPRRDIDLIGDVGLVGRDDRDAEHLAEAGCEDEEPHQWAHQRRYETLALMQEAQGLAPHDAVEADDIFGGREASRALIDGGGAHGARPPNWSEVPVRRMKAALISCAPASLSTLATSPRASTRT